MSAGNLNLAVHESTDDIRPGRDDPGLAGRDSTQPRCALRSSVARGIAGSGGNELSAGVRDSRRFAWDGGKLDSPLREVWLWRFERSGRPRPTLSTEAGTIEASRGSLETQPGRLRTTRAALGRPPLVEFSGEAVWGDASRPAMPAIVPKPRVSAAQTSPRCRSSKPATSSGGKKNSSVWQEEERLICGRWTKSISSSTVAAAECGFRQRFVIQSAITRRLGRASATSEPCELETG